MPSFFFHKGNLFLKLKENNCSGKENDREWAIPKQNVPLYEDSKCNALWTE
jgi:hypothetical protein